MKDLTFNVAGLKIILSSSYKQVGLDGFNKILPLAPLSTLESAELFVAKIPV
jgi:hypothetical protein